MTQYTTELNKPEYQSLSNKERLELIKSKTEEAVGRIEEGKLKLLESYIADGLWRDKMEDMKAAAKVVLADTNSTAEQKALAQTKMKIVAGFHEAISEAKLANKAPYSAGGHTINMNDPTVQLTFNAAVSVGLISATEAAKVLNLAKYSKVVFPDVTMKDIVTHFNPELIAPIDTWQPLTTSNSVVNIWLKTKAPESTHIVIQHQDALPDGSLSDWRHSTAVHGVELVGEYQAAIPTKAGRSYRWRCEYVLDVVVS